MLLFDKSTTLLWSEVYKPHKCQYNLSSQSSSSPCSLVMVAGVAFGELLFDLKLYVYGTWLANTETWGACFYFLSPLANNLSSCCGFLSGRTEWKSRRQKTSCDSQDENSDLSEWFSVHWSLKGDKWLCPPRSSLLTLTVALFSTCQICLRLSWTFFPLLKKSSDGNMKNYLCCVVFSG